MKPHIGFHDQRNQQTTDGNKGSEIPKKWRRRKERNGENAEKNE